MRLQVTALVLIYKEFSHFAAVLHLKVPHLKEVKAAERNASAGGMTPKPFTAFSSLTVTDMIAASL